jgi:hypothetical protein
MATPQALQTSISEPGNLAGTARPVTPAPALRPG